MLSLKDLPDENTPSKILLFIPFSKKEHNDSLYLRALDWRLNQRTSEKFDKIPEVVIYRRQDETDEDYPHEEYSGTLFQITKDTVPKNTVIYILADGMGHPQLVSNINNKKIVDTYVMSAELIAYRLKKIGLTPELAQNLKEIRLFICEESNKNDLLATNFAKALGEKYQGVNIRYYTASVSLPVAPKDGSTKAKKRAVEFSGTGLIMKGTASQNRMVINVGAVLREEKESKNINSDNNNNNNSSDAIAEWMMQEDKAMKMVNSPPVQISEIREYDDTSGLEAVPMSEAKITEIASSSSESDEESESTEKIQSNENDQVFDQESLLSTSTTSNSNSNTFCGRLNALLSRFSIFSCSCCPQRQPRLYEENDNKETPNVMTMEK